MQKDRRTHESNHTGISFTKKKRITGVTVVIQQNNQISKKSFAVSTKVSIYPMTDSEIHNYIASGDPMDKAGSYGIQGIFAKHIRHIDGDYNNVVGLPIAKLYQEVFR